MILEYLDKKTRALQQQNKIAAWLLCIVRGLMWLLEKIVAFINRNAFILVAGEVFGRQVAWTVVWWSCSSSLMAQFAGAVVLVLLLALCAFTSDLPSLE